VIALVLAASPAAASPQERAGTEGYRLAEAFGLAVRCVICEQVAPEAVDLAAACERLGLAEPADRHGEVSLGSRVQDDALSSLLGERMGDRCAAIFELGIAIGRTDGYAARALLERIGLGELRPLLAPIERERPREPRPPGLALGPPPPPSEAALATLRTFSRELTRRSGRAAEGYLWSPSRAQLERRPEELFGPASAEAWAKWLRDSLGERCMLRLHLRPYYVAERPVLPLVEEGYPYERDTRYVRGGVPCLGDPVESAAAEVDPQSPVWSGYLPPRCDILLTDHGAQWARQCDSEFAATCARRMQDIAHPYRYLDEESRREEELRGWTWRAIVPDVLARVGVEDREGGAVPVQFVVDGRGIEELALRGRAAPLREAVAILLQGGALDLVGEVLEVAPAADEAGSLRLVVAIEPTSASFARGVEASAR